MSTKLEVGLCVRVHSLVEKRDYNEYLGIVVNGKCREERISVLILDKSDELGRSKLISISPENLKIVDPRTLSFVGPQLDQPPSASLKAQFRSKIEAGCAQTVIDLLDELAALLVDNKKRNKKEQKTAKKIGDVIEKHRIKNFFSGPGPADICPVAVQASAVQDPRALPTLGTPSLFLSSDLHPCSGHNLFSTDFSQLTTFPEKEESRGRFTLGHRGAETHDVIVKLMKSDDVLRFVNNYKQLSKIGLGHRLQEPIAFIPYDCAGEKKLGVFKHAEHTKSLVEFAENLRDPIHHLVCSGGGVSEAFRIGIIVLKDLFKIVQLLHCNNFVHRSLGPRSIMIDYENKVLLKYFDESGSCKFWRDREASMPSRSDSYHSPMAAGNEINDFFIPPQVRNWTYEIEEHIDPRLPDHYACGALVYYILSGAAVTPTNSKLLDNLPLSYNLNSTDEDIVACIKISEQVMPELKSALARDLVMRLTKCSPNDFGMPRARSHPLFWDPAYRMEFLREVSTLHPMQHTVVRFSRAPLLLSLPACLPVSLCLSASLPLLPALSVRLAV